MPTLNEIRTLKGHAQWVRALAVSPDGRVLVSGSEDQTIKLWELTTGRHFRTLTGHSGGVRGIAFSPDGRRFATASWDRTVKIWEGGPEGSQEV
jgi:WD40 repeat protein